MARHDLDAQTRWFHAEASVETAMRFAAGATQSFAALARSPGIGSPLPFDRQQLAGLRKWRVEGFPRMLIFYRPTDDGIVVVRVLHAAQDWAELLDRP